MFNSTRRKFLASAAAVALFPRNAAAQVNMFSGASVAAAVTGLQVLKLGAGGFISGMQIAPDGTAVIRTDVGGGYTRRPGITAWSQTIVSPGFPDAKEGSFTGVYEIAIADSLPSTMYLYYSDDSSFGYVYKSTDYGATWVRTAFASVLAPPNDQNTRGFNRKMAVDPANPDIVYVGTPQNGVFKTINGGGAWTSVTAVGTGGAVPGGGANGGHIIAFDPRNVISHVTQGIWIGTYGTGMFQSTDGGVNWTATNPTGFVAAGAITSGLVVDQFGFAWLTSSTTIYKWNGTAWSTYISDTGAVVVDPTSATQATSRVFVIKNSGAMYISTDGGTTTVGPAAFTYSAGEVPGWFNFAADSFLSVTVGAFDPTQSNVLYIATGIGVFETNPPNTNVSFALTAQTTPIEELVINRVVSPPGGDVAIAAWDRPVWLINDPASASYPSRYYPNNTYEIVPCWDIDYASSDPTTLVAVMAGAASTSPTDLSGFMASGGTAYTQFAALPPQASGGGWCGCISATTPTNILWCLSDDGGPYYSSDGGATWHACATGQAGANGWHHAYYLNEKITAADRGDANTFYIYNSGTGTVATDNGIYKSVDGGATWTKPFTGTLGAQTNFNFTMKAVPGNSGHLFATGGAIAYTPTTTQTFNRSTDHGATWNPVTAFGNNILEVVAFGFGKIAPGQTYPAVYFYGFVNSGSGYVLGYYRSIDNFASVQLLENPWPAGWWDTVKTIEGDMRTYGRMYVGFSGTGARYGDFP